MLSDVNELYLNKPFHFYFSLWWCSSSFRIYHLFYRFIIFHFALFLCLTRCEPFGNWIYNGKSCYIDHQLFCFVLEFLSIFFYIVLLCCFWSFFVCLALTIYIIITYKHNRFFLNHTKKSYTVLARTRKILQRSMLVIHIWIVLFKLNCMCELFPVDLNIEWLFDYFFFRWISNWYFFSERKVAGIKQTNEKKM